AKPVKSAIVETSTASGFWLLFAVVAASQTERSLSIVDWCRRPLPACSFGDNLLCGGWRLLLDLLYSRRNVAEFSVLFEMVGNAPKLSRLGKLQLVPNQWPVE